MKKREETDLRRDERMETGWREQGIGSALPCDQIGTTFHPQLLKRLSNEEEDGTLDNKHTGEKVGNKTERIFEDSMRFSLRDSDRQAEAPVIIPLAISPSLSLTDTWAPSVSNHSPPSISATPSTSSPSPYTSPVPSLTPPLPPYVELSAVLTDTRLTLDVYKGGAAVLQVLWRNLPGHLRGVQYLRLGSEDKAGLDGALEVLPHLTQLHSLAIRGHRLCDAHGSPLPGLLTALPSSLTSLSLLKHLDLSFNTLSSFPLCLVSLPHLSSLLLSHNQLTTLPPDIGKLSSLSYLTLLGNQLVSVPQSLGQLKTLQNLDLSYNFLQSLPEQIGALEALVKLQLSHNNLKRLPETMGSLKCLRELVIHSNDLRVIPQCLTSLPLLEMDVRNNPIGSPPTPPPLPPAAECAETSIPELHLGFDQHSFCVSSAGLHVFLPGAGELLFPPGCLVKNTRLKWAEKRPDRKWVWLEEHDFLLSRPLELVPHGITFLKPVEVCVPYHGARRREVVVRRFDGQSWSTLPTLTRRGSQNHSRHPGGRPARLACCSVTHFSWFVAVSRPVRDSCSLTPQGALLVSSSDPGVKLHFPPDSTLQTRVITLQVLQVSVAEVQELSADREACVSPLLCLSQNPSLGFLQPVKVQIPLPSGLTGHTVDMLSTWLLSPHRSYCGHVVNMAAFSSQVDGRVESLSVQYDGPQPSDLCDLLEGEQFFAGFERGLDVNADRPDCVEGRLCFVFYSRLKNLKEVYVCPAQGHDGPVRGQVSFYRGEVPNDLPVEVARKRKGNDSQWLATLPLRLPVSEKSTPVPTQLEGVAFDLKHALNSEKPHMEDYQYPPLNLGDPESGYLTEANLLAISLQIGQDWRTIGINLGISYQELDRIQYKYRDNLGSLVLDMLFHWARGQQGAGPGVLPKLIEAMEESGRRDLAEEIQDIVSLGRRKYSESLRRVGLDEEASSAQSEAPHPHVQQ
ncbi:p53-induced death domain-containing protein 1 [Hypomesus transpacificus]|uniref:p53-induced death domain-containing protein 1 n=1 Tax=Hypomesus transpacificus TaxID=137520 RepID=UPI001F088346|nr:p53-induced death domain-containing protein 1 [Hypomesus transpacificus]